MALGYVHGVAIIRKINGNTMETTTPDPVIFKGGTTPCSFIRNMVLLLKFQERNFRAFHLVLFMLLEWFLLAGQGISVRVFQIQNGGIPSRQLGIKEITTEEFFGLGPRLFISHGLF